MTSLEYFIMDKGTNRFYMSETEYIPWVCYAFTYEYRHAMPFNTAEDAAKRIAAFERTKTEFDGNTPLAKGRLIVVRIDVTPVPQRV